MQYDLSTPGPSFSAATMHKVDKLMDVINQMCREGTPARLLLREAGLMILDNLEVDNREHYNDSPQFAKAIGDLRPYLDWLAELPVRYPVDGKHCPVCGTPLHVIPSSFPVPKWNLPASPDIIFCDKCTADSDSPIEKIRGVVHYGEY